MRRQLWQKQLILDPVGCAEDLVQLLGKLRVSQCEADRVPGSADEQLGALEIDRHAGSNGGLTVTGEDYGFAVHQLVQVRRT